MYFILKFLFPRGGKFVTTRGNKKFVILQALRKQDEGKKKAISVIRY